MIRWRIINVLIDWVTGESWQSGCCCCCCCSQVFACCCPFDNYSTKPTTTTSPPSRCWRASFCPSPSRYSACAEQLSAHLLRTRSRDHVTQCQSAEDDERRRRRTSISELWCRTEATSARHCPTPTTTGWHWWRSRAATPPTDRYRSDSALHTDSHTLKESSHWRIRTRSNAFERRRRQSTAVDGVGENSVLHTYTVCHVLHSIMSD